MPGASRQVPRWRCGYATCLRHQARGKKTNHRLSGSLWATPAAILSCGPSRRTTAPAPRTLSPSSLRANRASGPASLSVRLHCLVLWVLLWGAALPHPVDPSGVNSSAYHTTLPFITDAISDTGVVLATFFGMQTPLCLDVERAIRQQNGRAVLTSRHNLSKRAWCICILT